MPFKLGHKFFLINVSVIIVLTSVFLYLSHNSSRDLFSQALNAIDREVIRELSHKLSDHYRQNPSWETFTNTPPIWEGVVNETFFKVFFEEMEKAKRNMPKPLPAYYSHPANDKPVAWEFPFGTFFQRLTLLDANKNTLIQSEFHNDEARYQAIKVDGKTVGWLRVGKIHVDMLPLAQYFFEQQLVMAYWFMVIGSLTAIVLSYLLSRHITAPIQELTIMAQKIGRRDFSGRVHVQTRDELQILGEGLNYAAKALELYQMRQQQWLMDVSHELKTPLTVLIGEIYAICDGLTQCDEQTAQMLADEAARIKRITDDLHEIVREESPTLKLHCKPIDFRNIVEKTLSIYRSKLQNQGLIVHTRFLDEPVQILADSERITQVFSNLLENCWRYAKAPGDIWIQETLVDEHVILTIEDAGPGVPEETLNHLFTRYYQIPSEPKAEPTDALTQCEHLHSKTNELGLGLGLAICKNIIQAHKGSITANIGTKGGLKITISLPQHEACYV